MYTGYIHNHFASATFYRKPRKKTEKDTKPENGEMKEGKFPQRQQKENKTTVLVKFNMKSS